MRSWRVGPTRNWWRSYSAEDAGYSGETLDRPALIDLLIAAENNEFDVVLIADDSRLARSNLAGITITDRFRNAAVAVATPSGIRNLTAPDDEYVSVVLTAGAAMGQRRRTEKMMKGLEATARAGFWSGGPPPFGYRLGPDPSGSKNKVLEINEEEAAVIHRAVELVVDEGHSLWTATPILNAEGLHTRSGRPWRWRNLTHTLKREHLAGIKTVWSAAMDVPVIIPTEWWEALQRRIRRQPSGRPTRKKVYPLTGRIRCRCGGSLSGVYRKENDRRYYWCSNRHPEPDDAVPRCPHYPKQRRADDLEQPVWEAVHKVLTDPDFLLRLAEEQHHRHAASEAGGDQIASIDRRLQELRHQEVRIVRDLNMKPDLVHRALKEIAKDRSLLVDRRARLMQWKATSDQRRTRRDALKRLASVAHQRLQNPTPELQRQVDRLLDLEVQETADGLQLSGNIPLPGEHDGDDLALAVGDGVSELRSKVPRDP